MAPISLLLLLIFSLLQRTLSFSAFERFQFAPNGVCVSPQLFCDTQHGKTFTMKNVPGEGDCMFLAVALASLTSLGLGGNDALLNSISQETRNVVANILESPSGNLVVENKRLVSTTSLLNSAAKQEGVSPQEYLEMLRNGTLYGGGPELTVLSNILRRPISIYELENDNDDSASPTLMQGERTQPIVCRGIFGSNTFRDTLQKVPNSAILNAGNERMPGAYSWHLHILVVDTVANEKHACVLLPQTWKRISGGQ